ncbi:MAG TPA: hypothetical protein VMC62_01730 [Longilinea sp.]|nr:hypothetical protein [Longilinea sp.]
MEAASESKQIIVAPQVFVSLATDSKKAGAPEIGPCHADISVAWSWDEASFRMDVSVPEAGALDIIFPLKADIVYVNGEIVWDSKGSHKIGAGTTTAEPSATGLRLNFAAGGPYHILVRGLSGSETL